MDEKTFLKRKIFLKGLAIQLLREERRELRERLSLLLMRDRLLKKIGPTFDRALSRKVDAVDFLLSGDR